MYNCAVGCTCHEKKLSTAPLRATLGTLRAGSPFRVLPQTSLEGISALSAQVLAELRRTVGAQNPKAKHPQTHIQRGWTGKMTEVILHKG